MQTTAAAMRHPRLSRPMPRHQRLHSPNPGGPPPGYSHPGRRRARRSPPLALFPQPSPLSPALPLVAWRGEDSSMPPTPQQCVNRYVVEGVAIVEARSRTARHSPPSRRHTARARRRPLSPRRMLRKGRSLSRLRPNPRLRSSKSSPRLKKRGAPAGTVMMPEAARTGGWSRVCRERQLWGVP